MFSSTKTGSKTSYDFRHAIETLYVDTAKFERDADKINADINANTQKIDDMTLFGELGGAELGSSKSPAKDVSSVFQDDTIVSSSSSANSTGEKRRGSSETSSVNSATTQDKDFVGRQDSFEAGDSIFVECTTEDANDDDAASRKSVGLKKRPSFSQLFRRLSMTERQATRVDAKRTAAALADIKVESLPQQCSARYLGSRPCSGLAGSCHVRGAVEELVEKADKRANNAGSIPSLYLLVSKKGVHVAKQTSPSSPLTKSTQTISNCSMVPVEHISYGTQDVKYSAVFCFIQVQQLSSGERAFECHAYVCESPVAARKMSQALKLSFRYCADRKSKENGRKVKDSRRSSNASEN